MILLDFPSFRVGGSAGNGTSNRARMVDSVAGDTFKNIFFIPTVFFIGELTNTITKVPPKPRNIVNFTKNVENHEIPDFRVLEVPW